MYFRFVSAVVLVVVISLIGTSLEKRNLELRRAISQQHYQWDVLIERYASHRAEAERLGAPGRLLEVIKPPAAAEPAAKPERKKRKPQ